jgi:hypothetical protein
MRTLLDRHAFEYCASVPWPGFDQQQLDWEIGVKQIECWLTDHVGQRLISWAWSDSGSNYQIGVAFRWDQHRLLFVLAWA